MTYPYLTLDDLRTDSELARRLPQDLARRLHAIPVAEDDGLVTVAMAHPEDVAARSLVAEALGTVPFVVQCDEAAIDALLSETWSAGGSLHLLAVAASRSTGDELSDAARLVGELLRSRVDFVEAEDDLDSHLEELAKRLSRQRCDLLICDRLCQSLIDRLFLGPDESRGGDRSQASLLVAQGLRWPLKRVLMVVGQESRETNEAALLWAERLTKHSGAGVTALSVVPPQSAREEAGSGLRPGLATLLDADTLLGRELRRIGERLADPDIVGRLRLRQGPPGWQLRLEIATGDYDLIIIGADAQGRWLRWVSGGQIGAFLRWVDRPVLMAKPSSRA